MQQLKIVFHNFRLWIFLVIRSIKYLCWAPCALILSTRDRRGRVYNYVGLKCPRCKHGCFKQESQAVIIPRKDEWQWPYFGVWVHCHDCGLFWLTDPPVFEEVGAFAVKTRNESGNLSILWANDGRKPGELTQFGEWTTRHLIH